MYCLFYTAIGAGIDPTTMIIAPYVTAKFTCTGPYGEFPPKWLLDGRGALTKGDCYNSTLTETGDRNATATLTIGGNYDGCGDFNIYCRIFIQSQFLYLHNTTLEMEGRLPSCYSIYNYRVNYVGHQPYNLVSHAQLSFPHLEVFNRLTPQLLNGILLTLQQTMMLFTWTLTSPTTLYTLLTIILEILSKLM